ncbi:MAG: hypothetical protein ACYSOI_06085 [Planctomycetota bacterium]|jgi:hypothetical protein
MKKILASLLVLALCAPAMAATITLEDIGGGQATITVATEGEEANIVGLGLDVVVTGGQVTDVSVDTADFNIFPDYAYCLETDEDPNDGYEYGEGHPVAAMLEAGKLELPQSSFALSLGNLNGIDIPGADGATEVVITVDWSGDLLEVCENATRGGIVANGEEAGIPLDAECAELEGGCVVTTCLGDGTVDGAVNGADVGGLIATFNLILGQPGYNCIYDFTLDDAVNGADIGGFLAVFNTFCP